MNHRTFLRPAGSVAVLFALGPFAGACGGPSFQAATFLDAGGDASVGDNRPIYVCGDCNTPDAQSNDAAAGHDGQEGAEGEAGSVGDSSIDAPLGSDAAPDAPCALSCPTGATCQAGACQCDTSQEPSTAACLVADAFGVFVAPPASGGSDVTGSGTMAAPYATIGKALASLGSKTRVFVCNGTYAEQVTVTTPVSLSGGLACPSGAAWSYVGGFAQVDSPSAAYALQITNVSASSVLVEDMHFAAPDRAPTDQDANANGNSSIAALVVSSNATFERVTLTAGKGANGAAGADGTATPNYPVNSPVAPSGLGGNVGPGTSGGPSATLVGGAGGTIQCANGDSSTGGAGATLDPSGSIGSGGNGAASPEPTPSGTRDGAGAPPSCAGPPSGTHGPDNGADGFARSGGSAASSYGLLSSSGWAPSQGAAGAAGSPGQGGGGSSDGQDGAITLADGGLSPVFTSGGGGGAGGCGGSGAAAGGGGGASIALASVGSLVALNGCTLIASNGGNGGAGGAGQPGQGGGGGGPAMVALCSGGATGGNGAGGSGGAGGTAGASTCIAFTGSRPVTDSATILSAGSGGMPGPGGMGGAGGANALGTGPSGSVGASGLAWVPATVLSVP